MPYISQDDRDELAHYPIADGVGQLNYQITMLVHRYVRRHGLVYNRISDVIGALEAAKLEFYRRVVVPYEDKKIKENGDVYDAN